MPNRDGTGPLGQGPRTGRRGRPGRASRNFGANAPAGTAECVCPVCGYKEPHRRGIPCSEKKCPKCEEKGKEVFMRGDYCK